MKESVAFGQKQSLLNLVAEYGPGGGRVFQVALGASLRHYPHELGLLLLKKIPKVIQHLKQQGLNMVK